MVQEQLLPVAMSDLRRLSHLEDLIVKVLF